jgi:rod shape-determining protein MreC
VAGMVYEAANNVTGYFHLKSINDDLVQKNVELELQMERLRSALMELTADSTGLEKMKSDALKGYDIYRADVINNSLTHVDNYITIDKGENDGIRPEMGVINGNGVVGIVYQTSANYSVVIPILNSKSSISCKIKRSDYFGFLKWDGGSSEYATVKDMPRHSLFSLGDTIVTSGHSAVFPGGIPIGTVEDMSDSHDGLSYLLKVKLFTDFGRLNDVRVIAQKGQEEQIELEQKVKGGNK